MESEQLEVTVLIWNLKHKLHRIFQFTFEIYCLRQVQSTLFKRSIFDTHSGQFWQISIFYHSYVASLYNNFILKFVIITILEQSENGLFHFLLSQSVQENLRCYVYSIMLTDGSEAPKPIPLVGFFVQFTLHFFQWYLIRTLILYIISNVKYGYTEYDNKNLLESHSYS